MARIRTVKPEFWQNEDLARLSHHARLLAIALLNHADDHGYFKANASLVRAACFPFDDESTMVRRSIDELSTIGYIEVRTSPSGREIGRVVKFREHQRIDRAKDSELEQEFSTSPIRKNTFDDASTIDRRCVDDASLLERKGTGNRETEREVEVVCTEATRSPSLPTCSDSDDDTDQDPPFDPTACEFPTFPCCGEPKTWEASQRELNAWQATYPAVDIDQHHRRAHAWIMANLPKRKTAKRMSQYLNTWFAKEQDKAGSRGGSQQTFAQISLENSRRAMEEFING